MANDQDQPQEVNGEEGIRSRQYRVSRIDWEDDVRILKMTARFYVQSEVEHEYEHLMVDGNPVYHLDTGPKKVRCVRRQNGMWLEGYHWRGHCPAIIHGEEVEVMAKGKGSTKTTSEKRKAEVATAKLGPKHHVVDPSETKTKGKKKEPRACACQCGQMTGGGYFFPGHDSKVKSIFTRLRDNKIKKADVNKVVLKMYDVWNQDKSVPVKDIAKQVLG